MHNRCTLDAHTHSMHTHTRCAHTMMQHARNRQHNSRRQEHAQVGAISTTGCMHRQRSQCHTNYPLSLVPVTHQNMIGREERDSGAQHTMVPTTTPGTIACGGHSEARRKRGPPPERTRNGNRTSILRFSPLLFIFSSEFDCLW